MYRAIGDMDDLIPAPEAISPSITVAGVENCMLPVAPAIVTPEGCDFPQGALPFREAFPKVPALLLQTSFQRPASMRTGRTFSDATRQQGQFCILLCIQGREDSENEGVDGFSKVGKA